MICFRAWNFCRNCGGNRRMYGERRLGSPMRCTMCKKRDDVKFVWCYNNLTWKVCSSNGPAVGVRAENVIGVPAEGLQHWTARAQTLATMRNVWVCARSANMRVRARAHSPSPSCPRRTPTVPRSA